MNRSIAAGMLVFVLYGSTAWWTRAAAQGINVRHDAYGWQYPRDGFSVEQNEDGEILVFSNGPYLDTITNLYWSSIICMERFSMDGEFLSQDTLWDADRATYVGWSNCSTVLPDGRVLISGSTFQNGDTIRTALYWFNATGELLNHIEILPNSRSWIAYQHKSTPDGGIILTGVTSATGIQDIFLLKTDSLGNVQWWQTYGHPTRLDYAASVDLAPNGGYYIGGGYPITPPDYLAKWVLRTDSVGNLIWDVTNGDPWYDTFGAEVVTTADGNVLYASGDFSGVNQKHWPLLVKLDTSGTVLWSKRYGFDEFGTGFFVVQEVSPYGDLIACGQRFFSNGMGGGYSKGTLLRTTADGDSLWMRDYAYFDSLVTDCEGTLRDVQTTPDGGFVAVGTTYGAVSGPNPPGLSQDVWVLKVDSLGCIIPGCDDFSTVITVQATNLREALAVYPNPAHGSTTVKVTLPLSSPFVEDLRLRLVSAQGQEVLVQRAVLGENTLDLSGLAAGVYYVHLTSGSTWLSGTKLVVE